MSSRIIAAAVLVAGITVQIPALSAQAPFAAATATLAPDPEAAAMKSWRESVVQQSPSGHGKGCFHVSYPNYAWESVACSSPKAGSDSRPNQALAEPGPMEGGSTGDYVGFTQNGFITHVAGTFYRVSGVTSEVNVNNSGQGTGSNQYGLQINTNWSLPTDVANFTSLPAIAPAACQGHAGCQIWQQFIYTSDVDGDPVPAGSNSKLFMQYWLFNYLPYSSTVPSSASNSYDNVNCEKGWTKSAGQNDHIDCHRNGPIQSVPVAIPASALGDVKLSATVEPNGNDELYFSYGPDAWGVIESDGFDAQHPNEDGISIATIWRSVEFQVVGASSYGKAQFNDGTVLGVTVNIRDGSGIAPTCLLDSDPKIGGVGTTGETNNLGLGPCHSTTANGYGAIQYLEGTQPALEKAVIEEEISRVAGTGVAAPVNASPSL